MSRRLLLLLVVLLPLVFVSFFVHPSFTSAEVNDAADDSDFTFNLTTITHPNIKEGRWIDKGINYVIQRVISIAAQTIGGIAVLGFSAGGLMLLISAGNDQLMEKGKNLMKYSLYGLVFVLAAYLLVMSIQALVTSIFIKY